MDIAAIIPLAKGRRMVVYHAGGCHVEEYCGLLGWCVDIEDHSDDAQQAAIIGDAIAALQKCQANLLALAVYA